MMMWDDAGHAQNFMDVWFHRLATSVYGILLYTTVSFICLFIHGRGQARVDCLQRTTSGGSAQWSVDKWMCLKSGYPNLFAACDYVSDKKLNLRSFYFRVITNYTTFPDKPKNINSDNSGFLCHYDFAHPGAAKYALYNLTMAKV